MSTPELIIAMYGVVGNVVGLAWLFMLLPRIAVRSVKELLRRRTAQRRTTGAGIGAAV